MSTTYLNNQCIRKYRSIVYFYICKTNGEIYLQSNKQQNCNEQMHTLFGSKIARLHNGQTLRHHVISSIYFKHKT